MRQGSITVFCSLILTIIIALICTSIESARVAASRMQIVNVVDQSMYSVFAEYDRDLLEHYNLFSIDAGYQTSTFSPDRLLSRTESYVQELLKPSASDIVSNTKVMDIQMTGSGITGYTLLTDGEGAVFKSQVIDYMRQTLGAQGVQLLLDKWYESKEILENQEQGGEDLQEKDPLNGYEEEKEKGEKIKEESQSSEETASEDNEEQTQLEEPTTDIPNPIEVIKKIKELGILSLVVKEDVTISERTINIEETLSKRQCNKGMGVVDIRDDLDSFTNNLLFGHYIKENFGHFVKERDTAGLSYQIEYLLQGTDSDKENLEGVVNKLLLIREGANAIHIYSDSKKKAQALALATTISSAIGLPVLSPVVELALILSWAYAESILDIRELLDGGKIPIVKDASTWQLSIENLPNLLNNLDSARKSSEKGLTYEDYLTLLLSMKNQEQMEMGCMELIENDIRNIQGREEFRIDNCITKLEIFMKMQVRKNKEFEITRSYGYDM